MLENNLDLKVARIEPALARANLAAEQAAFEAVFSVDASYAKLDSPTVDQTVFPGDGSAGGEPSVFRVLGGQQEATSINPAIVQPLRTGGELRLEAPFDRIETDLGRVLNPQYEQDLRFRLTQPLGRGFGSDATEVGIRVAAAQAAQARARQKLAVVQVMAATDRAYWRLDLARRALAVRERQFMLANDQLERAQRLVEAGQRPAVDVVRAESAVADAADLRVQARLDVENQQRLLRELLAVPEGALQLGETSPIVTATPPVPVPYRLYAKPLTQQAIVRRMDLIELQLRVAEQRARIAAAENEYYQPRLDVSYEFALNGLGGDWGEATEVLGDGNFQDHIVGLRYELPLGNRQRRERLRASLYRRLDALATLAAREQLVRRQVHDAVGAIDRGFERIVTARARVDAAERLLAAEQRQYDAGLRTATELIDAQTNLAAAELSLARAVSGYELARVDLAEATGTVLGKAGVEVEVFE